MTFDSDSCPDRFLPWVVDAQLLERRVQPRIEPERPQELLVVLLVRELGPLLLEKGGEVILQLGRPLRPRAILQLGRPLRPRAQPALLRGLVLILREVLDEDRGRSSPTHSCESRISAANLVTAASGLSPSLRVRYVPMNSLCLPSELATFIL